MTLDILILHTESSFDSVFFFNIQDCANQRFLGAYPRWQNWQHELMKCKSSITSGANWERCDQFFFLQQDHANQQFHAACPTATELTTRAYEKQVIYNQWRKLRKKLWSILFSSTRSCQSAISWRVSQGENWQHELTKCRSCKLGKMWSGTQWCTVSHRVIFSIFLIQQDQANQQFLGSFSRMTELTTWAYEMQIINNQWGKLGKKRIVMSYVQWCASAPQRTPWRLPPHLPWPPQRRRWSLWEGKLSPEPCFSTSWSSSWSDHQTKNNLDDISWCCCYLTTDQPL